MSYIDTFEHELVGFFAHLPLYHPLETVDANEPGAVDFNCDPTHLVLGGGGGEHPALVVRRPDCALAHFVTAWLKHEPSAETLCNGAVWHPLWDAFLNDAIAVTNEQVFEFAGWSVATYHHFYERCCSCTLPTPFDPATNGWFEWWLAACFGEVIFFSMPELVANVDALLPDVRTIIKHPLYTNVLTPLPGFNIPYGRVYKHGQNQQGYNRWSSHRQ